MHLLMGLSFTLTLKQKLKALSDYVFNTFLWDTSIFPDILIRDYAREIMEYRIYLGNYERSGIQRNTL
jgi:hypothetical protein